jgi:peptidyl-prolyl cis-trans isomerase A (cyclophilin A)
MTTMKVRMKNLLTPLIALVTATALLTACGGGSAGGSKYEAPQVTMTVDNGAGVSGSFVITLASLQAPNTTANFLAYVNSGYYNGMLIHRNSANVLLQGGGYVGPVVATSTPLPAPRAGNAPIANESGNGLKNTKYTVAMDVNFSQAVTTQFVINMADNVTRDAAGGLPGYPVFGTVTSGTELLAAMAAAPCVPWPARLGTGDCLPSPNITIISAVQTR